MAPETLPGGVRVDGEYQAIDGRPTVRFARSYPLPVAVVWQAVTSPEGLRHWFPAPDVSYLPEVGATITLGGDPYAPDGATGSVLAWESPGDGHPEARGRFGFDWGGDQLFLSVRGTADGCGFELLDLLETEGGAARNGAGWDLCLAALERHLEVIQPDERSHETGEGMDAFLPVLERYKAQGFPDDGWLPTPVEP